MIDGSNMILWTRPDQYDCQRKEIITLDITIDFTFYNGGTYNHD